MKSIVQLEVGKSGKIACISGREDIVLRLKTIGMNVGVDVKVVLKETDRMIVEFLNIKLALGLADIADIKVIEI
jgi:Fe2+ transport system protein FeoA